MKRRRPAVAIVYDAIKAGIVAGRFLPGTKLTHQGLAEQLRVSRTPVREALERLFQEGFVTRLPRRGFYVAVIDENEARELYGLREALELYALEQSMAAEIGRADLRRLAGLNRDYAVLVRDGMTRERMIVDRDFHLALAALAGNHALSRSLEAVFERRSKIGGLKMIYEPKYLRFFQARFEPLASRRP